MFGENPFKKIVNHQEKNDVENDPVIKELIDKIYEIAHSENSIGKGMTAEVFISKTNPDVCYKIMHNDGDYKFRHSVYDEGELLAKAEKISRNLGVKVPKPYYSILTKREDGNEFEVLVMERLHSTSIKDLMADDLDVPENFDFKQFASMLEEFFSKLHEQNIYHRDAHGGNIMIENETGVPCVIDFGASIEMQLHNEDPYHQINSQGETVIFTPDEHKIRQELRVNLRGHLFKKYGNKHNL
ncbi:MAG: AarF/UbiB family protein [Candidatus Moranbacteria bacterium]|nr:AarF/UbiB family protein [Candidatus Moranbacteria bacterium]